MSTSTDTPLYSFTAHSDDPAVELFLVDARQRLVARGRRELSTTQPPGVYTLKLRAGPSAREELIVLDRPLTHTVQPLRFASAIPLESTAQSHEYHQSAAAFQSSKVNLQFGHGASLFVFARQWTPSGLPPVSGSHPAQGLALYSAAGETLVDFHTQSDADLSLDPWAACRVELSPGIYRLGADLASGDCFEMTLPLIPGYFHKLFLLQSAETGRPDLARSSFLMSNGDAFDRLSPDSRLAEIARLALIDHRKVYDDVLRQILNDKWDNPMLGIFGAHILLFEPNPDLDLLRLVVSNLRGIMGAPHPDVEALALAAGIPTSYRFPLPPMLRQSWRIVLENSKSNPALVPPDSPACAIATQVTQQDPWLIWRRPDGRHQRPFADLIGDALSPALAQSVIDLVDGKSHLPIPALDELVDRLNVPPATVARFAGAGLAKIARRLARTKRRPALERPPIEEMS